MHIAKIPIVTNHLLGRLKSEFPLRWEATKRGERRKGFARECALSLNTTSRLPFDLCFYVAEFCP